MLRAYNLLHTSLPEHNTDLNNNVIRIKINRVNYQKCNRDSLNLPFFVYKEIGVQVVNWKLGEDYRLCVFCYNTKVLAH